MQCKQLCLCPAAVSAAAARALAAVNASAVAASPPAARKESSDVRCFWLCDRCHSFRMSAGRFCDGGKMTEQRTTRAAKPCADGHQAKASFSTTHKIKQLDSAPASAGIAVAAGRRCGTSGTFCRASTRSSSCSRFEEGVFSTGQLFFAGQNGCEVLHMLTLQCCSLPPADSPSVNIIVLVASLLMLVTGRRRGAAACMSMTNGRHGCRCR